jgi:hypothetical protein
MKNKGFFKRYINAIKDVERDFSERVYLILAAISELTVFIALIGDILSGERYEEILTLIFVLIFVPAITITSLYLNKIKFAMRVIIISLVFVILPALFFFGGGLEGGGVLWVIFAFLFIGLILSGKWKKTMLFFAFVETLICYLVEYYHPELVAKHSRTMFFVDSFISIILFCHLCYGYVSGEGARTKTFQAGSCRVGSSGLTHIIYKCIAQG